MFKSQISHASSSWPAGGSPVGGDLSSLNANVRKLRSQLFSSFLTHQRTPSKQIEYHVWRWQFQNFQPPFAAFLRPPRERREVQRLDSAQGGYPGSASIERYLWPEGGWYRIFGVGWPKKIRRNFFSKFKNFCKCILGFVSTKYTLLAISFQCLTVWKNSRNTLVKCHQK